MLRGLPSEDNVKNMRFNRQDAHDLISGGLRLGLEKYPGESGDL